MKLHYALLAATLVAGPVLAATPAQPAAKPATAAKKTTTVHTMTKTAPAGRINTATHTTKTGKTITYDCSKKGNMNKTACKK